MLATNLCLPQVEHIKSGTARDFSDPSDSRININAAAVSERNDIGTVEEELPVMLEEKRRTDCVKRFNRISGTIKRKTKKQDCARNRANAIPVHNPI